MINLFINGLSGADFYNEVTKKFYSESQEDFNLLAHKSNKRINFQIRVHLDYIQSSLTVDLKVIFFSAGRIERDYCTYFLHSDMYADIDKIEGILTAFACGTGYGC